MINKVRVYGKAQNRTALGIVNAYLVMYPHATLEDLKKAFPDQLNPDSGTKQIFMTEKEINDRVAQGDQWLTQSQGYFVKDDEWLHLADKTKVAVVSMWTKPSFERLVSHAAQYGIEIAKFEENDGVGKKGSFRLEYLNGYVPPKPEPKVIEKPVPAAPPKKSMKWLWILLCLVAIAVIVFLLMRSCNGKEPETIMVRDTVVQTQEVIVHDTLYVQQLAEIEEHFNAAEFKQGKADLSRDAEFVLHDLAKLMKQYPEMKLRIAGHTSAEGDAKLNQNLSEARAQAAVTFLVEHEGIESERLEAAGYGSSMLKNTEDPMAAENRRTEFEIIK